jgi:16S rRNA (guanine1516-N2)-methyltransferase
VLVVGENGLSFKSDIGIITVDFCAGAADYRRKHGGGKGQAIAKAAGLQSLKNPYILDATAGLGRDGFVLASLGAKIQMIERSPIIYQLLKDGLDRASQHEEVSKIAARISLLNANATEWMSASDEMFDVVYLDPMFPKRDKTSLVKKEMRVLQEILGGDEDADSLLEPAQLRAKYRVVVKRPTGAPHLANKKPSFQLEGKANRFDIYVNKSIEK